MKVKKKKKKPSARQTVVVDVPQLHNIVNKSGDQFLTPEERQLLNTSIDAMAERLRPRTRPDERASSLGIGPAEDGKADGGNGETNNTATAQPTGANGEQCSASKPPRPGHGRNSAAEAYKGATFIPVPHPELSLQCSCPSCTKGKLYRLKPPALLVRIVGLPPIMATVYHLDRLRCNLCEEIFTAPAPEGIGDEKYDASVASMLAVLHYGSGMPFYRIEKLQKQMGIDMPSTTQWDLVDDAANAVQPVHAELTRLTAQSKVLYHDDTGVRILDEVERPASHSEDRTGLHTTGFVSELADGHKIALYVSGPNHAGENMSDLLELRDEGLPALITMADGLSHNEPDVPPGVELLPGNCLTHGRRHFVKVLESFPSEVAHVIRELGLVYHYDQQAKDQGLTPEQRLAFHQEHSGPVMRRLRTWMDEQISERKTEPNSVLGKAINYNTKRWEKLTLFLREAGAPLDNTEVERSLKMAVLNRKNSLFYKTQHGADVGDLYMSVLRTCDMNEVNSFEYLNALQRHAAEVRANPAVWLPWNYNLQIRPAPD